MSNYSSNTFLRPLSQTDKIINIYDENLELKWQILPFTIKNTFIINNLLKISLDSDRVITLDFNSGNEARVALPILKSQIETLSGETPLRISRIIDNYIESVGTLGPTGPQGEIGMTGPQGEIGMTGPQGEIGMTGPQGEIGMTGTFGPINGIPMDGDYLIYDGGSWNATSSITINLNFEEPKSYNYITPYDLVVSSYQTSTTMSVGLSSSGITYSLGTTINQYGVLLITTDTAGLIILNGYKI